jgi:hypothetical protein
MGAGVWGNPVAACGIIRLKESNTQKGEGEMKEKTFGLVYRNGNWWAKDYRRVLKQGGLSKRKASARAFWYNLIGRTPIVELKQVVITKVDRREAEGLTEQLWRPSC